MNSPAALPDLKGFHVLFHASESLSNQSESWRVSTETLWLAQSLPLVQAACFVSATSRRDPEGFTGGLLGAGCGWNMNPIWSMGFRAVSSTAPTHPATDGALDFALQLRFRPARFFSMAWQAESLFMHPVADLPQERIHRLEFVFGEKGQFWSGFHLSERRMDWAVTGGWRWEILRGLHLVLSGRYAHLDRQAHWGGRTRDLPKPESFTIGANLQFQLDNLSFLQGFSYPDNQLHFTIAWSEKPLEKSILPDTPYLLLLDLSGELSETHHARFALHLTGCLVDSSCRGVLIKIGDRNPSWAQVEEWADWIQRLRNRKKMSFVYASQLTNRTFALAAGADVITLFPGGSLRIRGLHSTQLYFAQALSRLGVRADLVPVGTYKSAPEIFTRQGPSEPALSQNQALMDAVRDRFRTLVLQRRNMTPEMLQRLMDGPELSAEAALASGLVDGVLYADQVPAFAFRKAGRVLSLRNAGEVPLPEPGEGGAVALLVFHGEIVSEKGTVPNPLTQGRVVELKKAAQALARVAADPRFKAVVIRVDSPGGSATASEALWRLVARLNSAKPVFVSIGDMAASGGYYLAAGSRSIHASATSFVGSIGVFGGKFETSGLLEKLGITTSTVSTGPHADSETPYRPYTEEERAHVELSLKNTYQRFVAAVAAGRKFSQTQALRRADGRVVAGIEARRQGLVDHIGGLLPALETARIAGRLPVNAPVHIVFPPPEPVWKKMIKTVITDLQMPEMQLLFQFAQSIFSSGPWALWPEMPVIH